PDGGTVTYSYNELGQMDTVDEGDGHVTTLEYTEQDRINSILYPNGMRTTYDFDENERVTRTLTTGMQRGQPRFASDGSYIGVNLVPSTFEERITYDKVGNVLSITDGVDRSARFLYDDKYQLIGVTDGVFPAGRYLQSMSFDYAPTGDRLFKNQGTDSQTQYFYDTDSSGLRESHRLERVEQGGMTTRYGYDVNGNMVAKVGWQETSLCDVGSTMGLTTTDTADGKFLLFGVKADVGSDVRVAYDYLWKDRAREERAVHYEWDAQVKEYTGDRLCSYEYEQNSPVTTYVELSRQNMVDWDGDGDYNWRDDPTRAEVCGTLFAWDCSAWYDGLAHQKEHFHVFIGGENNNKDSTQYFYDFKNRLRMILFPGGKCSEYRYNGDTRVTKLEGGERVDYVLGPGGVAYEAVYETDYGSCAYGRYLTERNPLARI
ncbi:MAG: hypothetical protein ABIH41_02555, partial [Nanoarchaeota archaeon]